jgi:hypothetical protein
MSRFDELTTLLNKPDPEQRQALVLDWWQTLSQEERDDVLAHFALIVSFVQEQVVPIIQQFGEFGRSLVEGVEDFVRAQPEVVAYLAELRKVEE